MVIDTVEHEREYGVSAQPIKQQAYAGALCWSEPVIESELSDSHVIPAA
jgi:hypothetical protein